MAEGQLQPNVFVNEETLVLQKDISEKPMKQRVPHYTSQQMLTRSWQITANSGSFPTKITIPRFGAYVQKQKVNFRNRHKNRILSIDPRFKSDRISNDQNNVTYIHSETRLTSIGTPLSRKFRVHSNPIFPIGQDKKEIVTPKKLVTEATDDVYKAKGQDISSDVVPYVEQSAITKKIVPEIVDTKSTYETASDISDEKLKIGDFRRNSSRLFKSHVYIPVHIKRSRSSWTLPISVSSKSSLVPFCLRCIQPSIPIVVNTNNIKTLHEKRKDDILTTVLRNSLSQSLLAIGVICGLVLVTLCSWFVTKDAILSYILGSREVPVKHTGMKGLLMYLGGGLLYGIYSVLSSICNLLVIQRKDVLGNADEEKDFW